MESAMLLPVLALAVLQGVCPMTIGVGNDGKLFTDRFHGWYMVSAKTLESDLHGACYNDSNPHNVTSVKLALPANAPKPQVDLVFSILEKEGWTRKNVDVLPWSVYPKKPQ
jgi:hypothetical protein